MGLHAYVDGRVSGTEELAEGQDAGTVTLTLDEVPARVFLTVEASGDIIWPTLEGAARADGFDFSLSAAAPAGAKLHYVCDF